MLLGVVFLSEFGLEHLLTSDNRAFVFVLDNFDVFLLMLPEQFFGGSHFVTQLALEDILRVL